MVRLWTLGVLVGSAVAGWAMAEGATMLAVATGIPGPNTIVQYGAFGVLCALVLHVFRHTIPRLAGRFEKVVDKLTSTFSEELREQRTVFVDEAREARRVQAEEVRAQRSDFKDFLMANDQRTAELVSTIHRLTNQLKASGE